MFCVLWLLKPKLIKVLDLASRPGALWTIAGSNWWLVLVEKEPAASTVSLAKSGVARTEGTEVMAEASLSRVGLPDTCSDASSVALIKCHKEEKPKKPWILFLCPITANRLVKSLAQVAPVYKGEDGHSGGSKNCYGRNGNTTYVHVSPRVCVCVVGGACVERMFQL